MKPSPETKVIDLSIIIVSYNTVELTDACISSIYQSLFPGQLRFEVIVIDNNSQDGSGQRIKKKYPQVRLFENNENRGFGMANNQGISEAWGKTILLLNSDIFVLNNAIEKLYDFQKQQGVMTICGGKLFNQDNTPQASAGPAYSLFHIFIALFLKGDYLHITRYSPTAVKNVDWIMGACVMASATAFKSVGGFDEGIFMYMEEIDWMHRAKQKGYLVKFYPNAHFIHVGHASSSGRETPILNVFRGFIYFYKKHSSYFSQRLLQLVLIKKAILAICLFLIINQPQDRNLYQKALKIAWKF